MNPMFPAEEICLRGELSGAAGKAVMIHQIHQIHQIHHGENQFGDESFRIVYLNSADRTQLKAARRIEVSLRYMMQNLNRPIHVPALSAMVGLSQSSFFALFKSATGRTPLDFFIRARMYRAGELLVETMLQIKEVAAMLGYDDQFYFSRMFKSVYGMSPREYRVKKEETHNRKKKSAPKPLPLAYRSSNPPRSALHAENQSNDGGIQPASAPVKTCRVSCRNASSPPDKICSVSVQQ